MWHRIPGLVVNAYVALGKRLMPFIAGGAVEVRTDFGGVFVVSGISVNPGNMTAVTSVNTAVTVPGVRVNDWVVAVPPATLEAGVGVQGCQVTAADTVSLRTTNASAGAIDPAAANWDFLVFRR